MTNTHNDFLQVVSHFSLFPSQWNKKNTHSSTVYSLTRCLSDDALLWVIFRSCYLDRKEYGKNMTKQLFKCTS